MRIDPSQGLFSTGIEYVRVLYKNRLESVRSWDSDEFNSRKAIEEYIGTDVADTELTSQRLSGETEENKEKSLERVCNQTQLCHWRRFNDYTRQLHVSAPTVHLQVVSKRT